jgi:hypothetical protein
MQEECKKHEEFFNYIIQPDLIGQSWNLAT